METMELAENVRILEIQGKTIYLVGTAHVSKESVEEVRRTVEAVHPDAIAVELCPSRHKALTDVDTWKKMDIFRIIKEKKAVLLLVQLVLSSFYRRLGERLGVQPGAEMLEGIRLADQTGAKLILADRDIQITFKRVWGYLGFWNKCKLISHLLVGLFDNQPLDIETIEQLKKQDQLESIMAEFAEKFPEIKERLIDERDVYLAQMIRSAEGRTIVAVVGAGHMEGISSYIHTDRSLDILEQLPPKSIVPAIIGWGLPILILGMIVLGFFYREERAMTNVYIWVGLTGGLSALGAIAALAHPLAVLSAFVAAPITALHPLLAAGWVAGLVQARIKMPTVDDFEDLPNAVSSFRAFWTNPVAKILLVTALTNLGGTIGVFISAGWIATRSV